MSEIVISAERMYALQFAIKVAMMAYQDRKATVHHATVRKSEMCTYEGGVFVVHLGMEVRWQGDRHHGNKWVEPTIRFIPNVSKGDDGEIFVLDTSVGSESVVILQKKMRLSAKSRETLKNFRQQVIPDFCK